MPVFSRPVSTARSLKRRRAAAGGQRKTRRVGKVVLQLGRERVARAFAYAALARHDEVHAVGAPFADKLA